MERSFYCETCVSIWGLWYQESKEWQCFQGKWTSFESLLWQFFSWKWLYKLSDPVYKEWFFFSHCFVFCFGVNFASLSHPGQMADNGTPWLQSVLSVSHNNWYLYIFVQFFSLSLFFESLLQFSFENGHHSWKIEKVLSRSASECDYKNLPY